MRITRLRNKHGKMLSANEYVDITTELKVRFIRAGFYTGIEIRNGAVLLSTGRASFTINVGKLGYNVRANRCTIRSTKTGYKRTNTPTWTQREEFNHIVNNVLDKFKMSANIKSGDYTIRTVKSGRVNSWLMPEVYNNGYGIQVPSVLEIVPIKYAQDAVEWVDVNAPFLGAVPDMTPRFKPKSVA